MNIYCVVEVETCNAYCHSMPVVHAFTNYHKAEAFWEKRIAEYNQHKFLGNFEDTRGKKNFMYRFTDGERIITVSLLENMKE